MTAVRQSGTKGILYDERSELESDSTNEDESQTSEDSGFDSGSNMEIDDDEDIYFHRLSGRFSNSRSWRKEDFRPKIFQFQSNNCGIDVYLNDDSPLDFFKLFFNQELIQIIVNETNKFQASASDACKSSLSHQAKWSPTDSQEIYLFLATFMLMAHVRKHRIEDYWSTDHLIATPMFIDIMPRDRFLLILKFLHFNDNSSQSEGSETDIVYNRELGIAGSVVMRLMQPYLLKGHNLFVDSWFTSPALFEELHANSTEACGT
ncbi:unnamed protein product, partial [Didymodactylos carnosus]